MSTKLINQSCLCSHVNQSITQIQYSFNWLHDDKTKRMRWFLIVLEIRSSPLSCISMSIFTFHAINLNWMPIIYRVQMSDELIKTMAIFRSIDKANGREYLNDISTNWIICVQNEFTYTYTHAIQICCEINWFEFCYAKQIYGFLRYSLLLFWLTGTSSETIMNLYQSVCIAFLWIYHLAQKHFNSIGGFGIAHSYRKMWFDCWKVNIITSIFMISKIVETPVTLWNSN